MSFIELRNQLPSYSDVLAKETVEEIVTTLGRDDKKNKSHRLARFFDVVVSLKNWNEDERLKGLAERSYSYLKDHKKIRGDATEFKYSKKKFKHPGVMPTISTHSEKKSSHKKKWQNDPGSIANAGNTCYLGATLQALRHSEGFMNALQEKKDTISERIQQMIAAVQGNKGATVAVDKKDVDTLLKAACNIGFRQTVGHAGDAAEWCSFLITRCHMPEMVYLTENDGAEAPCFQVCDQEKNNKDIELASYLTKNKVVLDENNLPSFLPVVVNQPETGGQASLARIPHELRFNLISSGEEEKECLYKLQAVVTSGGHAVTWIPTRVNGARHWILYNDSRVSVLQDTDELQKRICQKAYLLLFDPVGVDSKQ